MTLRDEHAQALKSIIIDLYGPDFMGRKAPTKETARILEEIIVMSAQCDKKIRILLSNMLCGLGMPATINGSTGRWILGCARQLARLIGHHKLHFAGCINYSSAVKRTAVYESLK